MKLSELLTGLADIAEDVAFNGLALDSRRIAPGYIFIAVQGARQHGLRHAKQAFSKGAIAVIYDPAGEGVALAADFSGGYLIEVPGLAGKIGKIAARFHGDPSAKLAVIGITGTNGKTTCSHYLGQILADCGVIGTLGWGCVGKLQSTLNTTPDALAIQEILSELEAQGNTTVAMEVSSHGLVQGRVNGTHFTGALFTNLSQDHLDYHGSMNRYLDAKKNLFTWPDLKFAVVNLDDPHAQALIESVASDVLIWGFTQKGQACRVNEQVRADVVTQHLDGIQFTASWREQRMTIHTSIVGLFNVENILAVLTVGLAMGIAPDQLIDKLSNLQPVAGRMENFGGHGQPSVFVDYAHTADALDKVLAGLKPYCQGQLRLVFGCGGDRDKGKRPQMGTVAENWADEVIVTDDNPRTEQPETIVEDILSGCRSQKISVIHDRKQAIHAAIAHAARGDCIVVAGKGHEQYQEYDGRRLPFSDQAVVKQALNQWKRPL